MTAGFALRMRDLGVQSLWLDEAISSIAATALLKNGMPILPSGILYYRGILNTFLIASSFKIFGVNEFAARLPSVLFGTLTILLVYIIGSRWGNRRVGIIVAFLVAFSVWEIAWSRQARMYQQLQFFYILSLYLFYGFIQNKNMKNVILLFFSVLGAIMSHVFGYALIVVFLIYLIVSTLKERSSLERMGKKTIAMVLLVFGASLALAYSTGVIPSVLKTDINYYNTYIGILKRDLGIFLFLAVPGGTVLVNRDWKKGLLLIAALIIPLYFIFFHVLMLGTRYLYFVVPILFILTAYFLDFVVDCLRFAFSKAGNFLISRNSDRLTANIIVVLLLVLAMYLSPAFTFTPKEKYSLGINAPQSNFRDAYVYVKENMQPDDVIISAWTPPAQFYLGKSDYWLAFNVVGTGIDSFMVNNTSCEIYTNATVIENVDGLEIVTKEYDRGWIVVDNLAWYKLSPELRDYIDTNTEQKLHDATIRVYKWSGGRVIRDYST